MRYINKYFNIYGKPVLSKHLQERQNWLLKVGACLIQVQVNFYTFLLRVPINWPSLTGNCLIQIDFMMSLTVK